MKKIEAYITENSFGAELPMNWEAAAELLNAKIDALEEDEDGEIEREEVDAIWEAYCAGEYDEELKTEVIYQGGESRTISGQAVDYMLATVGDTELYAELPAVEDDETANYDALKAEILRQADEAGIAASALRFAYDEEA